MTVEVVPRKEVRRGKRERVLGKLIMWLDETMKSEGSEHEGRVMYLRGSGFDVRMEGEVHLLNLYILLAIV
jgi:hypothetical protein